MGQTRTNKTSVALQSPYLFKYEGIRFAKAVACNVVVKHTTQEHIVHYSC